MVARLETVFLVGRRFVYLALDSNIRTMNEPFSIPGPPSLQEIAGRLNIHLEKGICGEVLGPAGGSYMMHFVEIMKIDRKTPLLHGRVPLRTVLSAAA